MFIERTLHKEIRPFIGSEEAIVITGMRRTGKTTLLRMIFDELPTENKLFFDLEDPLSQQGFSVTNYDSVVGLFEELGLNRNERMYVFIDEIQSLPHLPSLVKYLIDHYKIKFFLSGSASFYIKNMFSESMSGRKYLFEIFPFSFDEFLRAKQISPSSKKGAISEYSHVVYSQHFDEYMKYGGFPSVVVESNLQEKIKKIKDVFSSYWSLEVERLSDFKKKDKVRDFIFLLMERTGSKIDVSKLSRELGVAKETLGSYLSFLQDTYLISTISPFSTNKDVEIRGAKKMYFCDTGLLNQFSRLNQGAIFENVCYNLLRHNETVQYYQKKDGQEIDFIVNRKTAYEVKLTATPQNVKTLSRRAESIGIKEYKLISRAYSKDSRATYGFLL